MRRRWILAAAMVLLAAAPPGGPANGDRDPVAPPAAGGGSQEELESLAARLGQAWGRGDAAALASWMAADGISLYLAGTGHPALELRQARASLADFLEAGGPGTVRTVRAEVLAGATPARGLVELAWTPRSRDASARAAYGVFFALERRAEGWRATEIRIVR